MALSETAHLLPSLQEVAADSVAGFALTSLPWAGGLLVVPALVVWFYVEVGAGSRFARPALSAAVRGEAGSARTFRFLSTWPVVAGFMITGLLSRALFGLWGPLHVNGQGPHWIASVLYNPELMRSYGPGYAEVVGMVARLLPCPPDVPVFGTNLALSSLVPALTWAVACAAGLSSGRALLAGAILLSDPVLVRTGASEGYFTVILVLSLASCLAMFRSIAYAQAGSRARCVALLLSAALLASQAVRVHPVAWMPTGLALLLPLASSRSCWATRKSLAWSLAAGLFFCVLVLLTSGAWMERVAAHFLAPRGGVSHFSYGSTPALPWVRVGVVLAAGACAWISHPRGPFLVGWLGLIAAAATGGFYAQGELWQASYVRLFLPLAAVGAVTVLCRWSPRPWLGPVVCLAWFAGTLAANSPALFWQNTEQMEYRFLAEQLSTVPGDCRLAVAGSARKRALRIPDYVSADGWQPAERTADIEDPAQLAALAAEPGCLYYVRASPCSRSVHSALCQALESTVAMQRVAYARLPARPSFEAEPYEGDVVEVAVFRILR